MRARLTEQQTMKPLAFCSRSILAWQRGAKTQTRRLLKPQPREGLSVVQSADGLWIAQDKTLFELLDQPYAVGDLLWIREALRRLESRAALGDSLGIIAYAADNSLLAGPNEGFLVWHWKRPKLPAMFMPKWACRYYARIVSVRAEWLQEITDEDALAEGVMVAGAGQHWPPVNWYDGKPHDLYLEWWDDLHKKPGTRSEDNPWEWVYGLEAADASTE